jgi:hypothetical protein
MGNINDNADRLEESARSLTAALTLVAAGLILLAVVLMERDR